MQNNEHQTTQRHSADKSHPPSDLSWGWHLRASEKPDEAMAFCHEVLKKTPEKDEAWHLLGLLFFDRQDYPNAVKHLGKAIELEPGQSVYHNNLGVIIQSAGRDRDAEIHFREALKLDPGYHDARCNLGLALYRRHELSKAAACFADVISADGNHGTALANLGMTLLAQQRYTEAASAYEKAIGVHPNQPNWHGNLGAAYLRLSRFEEAVRCYRRASQLDPDNPDYWVGQGVALRADRDLPESIRALETALSLDPGQPAAISNLVTGLEYTCQWDKLELFHPMLHQVTREALAEGKVPDEDPMLNIRRSDDVQLNRDVGKAWSRDIQIRVERIADRGFSHRNRPRRHKRITLGYLSYDFRNHPVTHQLHPLFRLHDRKKFRVVAISMGPDDGSIYRRKIEEQCDEFIDISSHGLAEAAQTIYNLQVDVLIDLMGYSHHHRLGILSLRPAPVQVGYLGFLSTTGADFVDYLIADQVVVPSEHLDLYAEKLLLMPHCYQLNHKPRMDMNGRSRREQWGLPSDGFVFCCFNSAYKIDRSLFDAWMRILNHTPGAILWLSDGNSTASENMRSRAEALGINRQRLVFADKIPLEEHLKRLALADLALDTLRYNGGATTANALSVGLPLITVKGRHWVSRMSASHLIAAGLADLVFESSGEYEQAAIEMANRPESLLSVRRRLVNNMADHPLFDPQAFTRHLESGFELIWERYGNGEQPDHIDLVDLLPGDLHPAARNSDAMAEHIQPSNDTNIRRPNSNTRKTFGQCTIDSQPSRRHLVDIHYLCPDISLPSAGIRRLYRHVHLLQTAGFKAHVLHQRTGFHLNEMPDVSIRYLDTHRSQSDCITVIPEGFPAIMKALKGLPGRRFVIALNWDYVFKNMPGGLDWRSFNIERVLVVSPVIGKMVEWAMGLPVHQLASSINHQLYRIAGETKGPQIVYIQRKAPQIDNLKKLLMARNPDFLKGIKWTGLDGLAEEDYAAQIRKSSIFLNLSPAEGYPTSCLEAMAAGTMVAGYDAVGGQDLLCGQDSDQNCILAQNSNYLALAYELEPVLNDLLQGKIHRWQHIISNARATASRITPEKERQSLIAFWEGIVCGAPQTADFDFREKDRQRAGIAR